MSDFFQPPPRPEPPREHRQPEWFGPPENVLPVVLPLQLELARGDDFALATRRVDVYPTGAAFQVLLLLRRPLDDPGLFLPFHPGRSNDQSDFLRLGVQYADGAKATNMEMPFLRRNPEAQPPGPVMMPRGGGGGRHFDMSFWLWPLPKEDPFQLVVEWPAQGVELSRFDVAVAPLVEAAARCEELWPNGGGSDGGGGQTHLTMFSKE